MNNQESVRAAVRGRRTRRHALAIVAGCFWLAAALAWAADDPQPGASQSTPGDQADAKTGDRADAADAATDSAAAEAEQKPRADHVWYDSVTVTAARTAIDRTDVPANVSVLGKEEVKRSAAVTIDGVLRQVPGLATVREQNSIVGSVQSQSVSMRGLGGVNTSRTLVLLDGIPINDPYGGWVYWAKAPREIVDRVEVVRGGGASVWGNLALDGVINMMTIEPTAGSLSLTALQGDYETSDVTLALADAGKAWSGWLSGEYFDTDGYYVVRENQRGSVDEPTAKQYESYLGKGSWAPSPQVSLHLSADWWSENRKKGSPLDRGSAQAQSGVANASVASGAGAWDFHLFSRHQDWTSFGTRVSLDRNSEQPSSNIFDQPSDVLGASGTWSDEMGERHRLVAGADLQRIDIEHHQDLTYRNGVFNERQDVEGRQQLAGAFAQDLFDPSPRWTLQASARYNRIRNHDGQVVNSNPITGAVTSIVHYSDHDESTVDPSLGAVYRASDAVSLRASAYTGFRAPTTSELYKGFRAGSTTTESNSELESEHLKGAELGADYHPSAKFFGRVNGYWNELEDLILPTTVGVAGPAGAVIPPCGAIAPRGACRQRNNVGRVQALGVELEGQYRANEHWSFSLTGQMGKSDIESAPQLPELVGKRIPSSPERTFVAQVRFSERRLFDALLQGRYVSQRYDDDINTLSLDPLTVADLTLSHDLPHSISLFLGVENLFDQRYEVTRDTTGLVYVERRLAHIGLRFALR